jgi:hypothetical protein
MIMEVQEIRIEKRLIRVLVLVLRYLREPSTKHSHGMACFYKTLGIKEIIPFVASNDLSKNNVSLVPDHHGVQHHRSKPA